MMRDLWVIVLAAGEGSGLRPLAREERDTPVPKQFCSFGAPRSLLGATLARAQVLVPPKRVVTVVARHHRRWWEPELSRLAPHGNVIVQPGDRGTAVSLLLGALHVLLRREPTATFVVMPSDHYVVDEEPLLEAVLEAVPEAWPPRQRLVLLGMEPDEADPGYGWILPAPSSHENARDVSCFLEKPARATARHLMRRGALLSSLIFVAMSRTLLGLYEEALPDLLRTLVAGLQDERGWDEGPLEAFYRALPPHDLSRDVLQEVGAQLSVLPVPPCGWLDVGNPARRPDLLERHPSRPLEPSPRGALASRGHTM